MSEITATTIGELGRQVAEAIARGDYDRARELTELVDPATLFGAEGVGAGRPPRRARGR